MHDQFVAATSNIENFRRSNQRLPALGELGTLIPEQPRGYEITFLESGFDQCDSDKDSYEQIKKGEYLLIAWRGEWWECFYPAQHKTTLILKPNGYAMSRSLLLEKIITAMIVILCWSAAIWLWRKRAVPPR